MRTKARTDPREVEIEHTHENDNEIELAPADVVKCPRGVGNIDPPVTDNPCVQRTCL